MNSHVFMLVLIGVWLGQGVESLMLNKGWIRLSYNEMYYNFLITTILIVIYGIFLYTNKEGEKGK